jgi:hypothetical protein
MTRTVIRVERLPEGPPALDVEYLKWIRRRVAGGSISEAAALAGIRARAPHLTLKQAKVKLG